MVIGSMYDDLVLIPFVYNVVFRIMLLAQVSNTTGKELEKKILNHAAQTNTLFHSQAIIHYNQQIFYITRPYHDLR